MKFHALNLQKGNHGHRNRWEVKINQILDPKLERKGPSKDRWLLSLITLENP